MRGAYLCLVLTAALLAGCTSEPDQSPGNVTQTDSGSSAPPTPADESPPQLGPQNETYAKEVVWSDCEAITSATFWHGSPEWFPRPPGWEPEATRAYSRVLLIFMECDRVSWGPFERPVRMLIEGHNSGSNPPDCHTDGEGIFQYQLLNSVWTDDAEFGTYMESAYGLPVFTSPIEFDVDDLPVGQELTVRWGEGAQESYFTTSFDGIATPEVQTNFRHFWYNGTVLGAMDFYFTHTGDQTADNPATGEMHDPMLTAQFSEQYAAVGMYHVEASARGDIDLFRDLRCEQPL